MGMGKNTAWFGIWLAFGIACNASPSNTEEIAPQEPNLFSTSAQVEPVSTIGIRSRQAELNGTLFDIKLGPLDQPEENLRLNLFDDVDIYASRIRWAHLPNEGWSWHGVVPGDANSEITIVQNNFCLVYLIYLLL